MNTFKILSVTHIGYNNLISNLYRRFPEIKFLSYSEHLSLLQHFYPVHLNTFTTCMEDLGHKCDVIAFDLESLQKSWANERTISYGYSNWKEDILMEQIITLKPEIIIFQGSPPLSGWILSRLKSFVPSLKKIVVRNGCTSNIKDYRGIDLILGCTPYIVEYFLQKGLKSELLYYHFDDNILTDISKQSLIFTPNSEKFEFSFIGLSGNGSMHHHARYDFLEKLLQEININMWLFENKPIGSEINSLKKPLLEKYPTVCRNAVMGLEMYNIFKNSSATLNMHGDSRFDYVGNMRMFEATGMGTCLVTDSGKNMYDLFEPNEEVVTYNSIDECIEKLIFLRNNINYAKEIGKRAQNRVLKFHTLKKRCQLLNHHLQALFK